jgi:N-formylglutamate amidohydrolase
LDALHAASPWAELFTGEIVDRVSEQTGCHGIVATVSREVADLNRSPDMTNQEAVQEYRQTIAHLLQASGLLDTTGRLREPVLHLSFHGMRDRDYMDIEFGTVFGKSCSDELLQWLLGRFGKWAHDLGNSRRRPIIKDNYEWYGGPSIAFHHEKYGERFNTVQIELANWLRSEHGDDLVKLIVAVVGDFPRNRARRAKC